MRAYCPRLAACISRTERTTRTSPSLDRHGVSRRHPGVRGLTDIAAVILRPACHHAARSASQSPRPGKGARLSESAGHGGRHAETCALHQGAVRRRARRARAGELFPSAARCRSSRWAIACARTRTARALRPPRNQAAAGMQGVEVSADDVGGEDRGQPGAQQHSVGSGWSRSARP